MTVSTSPSRNLGSVVHKQSITYPHQGGGSLTRCVSYFFSFLFIETGWRGMKKRNASHQGASTRNRLLRRVTKPIIAADGVAVDCQVSTIKKTSKYLCRLFSCIFVLCVVDSFFFTMVERKNEENENSGRLEDYVRTCTIQFLLYMFILLWNASSRSVDSYNFQTWLSYQLKTGLNEE